MVAQSPVVGPGPESGVGPLSGDGPPASGVLPDVPLDEPDDVSVAGASLPPQADASATRPRARRGGRDLMGGEGP